MRALQFSLHLRDFIDKNPGKAQAVLGRKQSNWSLCVSQHCHLEELWDFILPTRAVCVQRDGGNQGAVGELHICLGGQSRDLKAKQATGEVWFWSPINSSNSVRSQTSKKADRTLLRSKPCNSTGFLGQKNFLCDIRIMGTCHYTFVQTQCMSV